MAHWHALQPQSRFGLRRGKRAQCPCVHAELVESVSCPHCVRVGRGAPSRNTGAGFPPLGLRETPWWYTASRREGGRSISNLYVLVRSLSLHQTGNMLITDVGGSTSSGYFGGEGGLV